MSSNWLNVVPTSDEIYMYQSALYCEDCGKRIIDELDEHGGKDDGDAEQYPQGPYSDGGGESDLPGHCDAGAQCVNAVPVPGGVAVGCPFGNPLTNEGTKYVIESIAANVLKLSDHSRAIGRLWRSIYPEAEPAHLVRVSHNGRNTTLPSNLGVLLDGLGNESGVPNEFYTDLDYVYGSATVPRLTYILWRAEITPEGNFANLETIDLPENDSHERSFEDALEEAVRDGAWD
jgi:hypothetical protein